MSQFADIAPLVDILYTISPTHIRALEKITSCSNIRLLLSGVDTERYYPVDVEKQFDLLFLGHAATASKTRNDIIVRLNQEFESMWVGGAWWEPYNLHHHFGGAFKHDFNEWNSRAKIGLCLVPDHHAVLEMYYPYRLVNTMATQTFALATYTPRLEEVFTRKKHLDWYTSYGELVELIHYWLAHDEEREQVARQGREFVLKNLTLKQQVGQILRDVGILT